MSDYWLKSLLNDLSGQLMIRQRFSLNALNQSVSHSLLWGSDCVGGGILNPSSLQIYLCLHFLIVQILKLSRGERTSLSLFGCVHCPVPVHGLLNPQEYFRVFQNPHRHVIHQGFFYLFIFFGQSHFPQLAKVPQAVVVLNKCQWLSADALKKGAFPTEWSLREIKEKKKQNQAPWIAFSREISGRSNSDHSLRIRLFERLHNLCTPSQGC